MSDREYFPNSKEHIGHQAALCSAKAVVNLIPFAIEGGATNEHVIDACHAVSNLIEVGHTDVEKNLEDEIEAGIAQRIKERTERGEYSTPRGKGKLRAVKS
jgi:hypothetical protein